jgi:hypothetical protein
MGGGHSTTNITNNIVNAISETIINAMQTTQNQLESVQLLQIDCSREDNKDPTNLPSNIVVNPTPEESYQRCIEISDKNNRSPEDIVKICEPLLAPCIIENINQKQTISVRLDQKQLQNIMSEVNSNLKVNIETSANQSVNGILQFGNNLKNKTTNVVNTTQRAISNILQDLNNNIKVEQVINLSSKGKILKVNNVTQESALDFISKSIQDNKSINKSILELSDAVKTEADQTITNDPSKILMIIALIIVGILIFIGVLLFVLKQFRKKDDNKIENIIVTKFNSYY